MKWIRIGFNVDTDPAFYLIVDVDPDPAFYLNADPDPEPGSQTNVDPFRSGTGSWSDLKTVWWIRIRIHMNPH